MEERKIKTYKYPQICPVCGSTKISGGYHEDGFNYCGNGCICAECNTKYLTSKSIQCTGNINWEAVESFKKNLEDNKDEEIK